MNLQLSSDNFDISDSVKTLVNEKISDRLDKLLQNLPPDLKIAKLRIIKDKYNEINLNFDMNLPGPHSIYAQTKHHLLESAVIDLEQEIEKQINRYRDDITPYSLG